MSIPFRTRSLRVLPALVLMGTALAACGNDDGADSDDGAGPTEETTSVEETTSPPAATIDLPTVEGIAQTAFAGVTECPDGAFEETDSLLTTLSDDFAAQATELHSYVCGGRIDQVVYAVLPDEATAAQALTPDADVASNAVAWVAGDVVVAMNYGVESDGVDIAAFFDDLTAACGCGESLYQG